LYLIGKFYAMRRSFNLIPAAAVMHFSFLFAGLAVLILSLRIVLAC